MIRRCEQGGAVIYQSNLLRSAGVEHAFSTRIGTPTLCDARLPVRVRQVHGSGVWVAERETAQRGDWPAADAVVSDGDWGLLAVQTADCVPVLLSDETGRVVAAVHAGWRGVVAGVVHATVLRMGERFGIEPRRILAAIGPCIGVAHFEVGPEVVAEFDRVNLDETVSRNGSLRIDLSRAVELQLQRLGVGAGKIEKSDRCTYRDAEEFFSYRREKGVTGRMTAAIAASSTQG